MKTRHRLTPGMLVRPKFNQTVSVWPEYTTRRCPDGVTRATMKRGTWLEAGRLNTVALVIGVPDFEVRNNHGTHLVQLFIPAQHLFAYAWDSSLVQA